MEGNQLAHAASLAVIDMPGSFNPVCIYGGTGSGKTHLLHAIAHGTTERNPSVRVACVSSEDYTDELSRSLWKSDLLQFRERYRDTDVLLLDDVQVLADKPRAQEELLHIFDSLYAYKKQIVLTSSDLPRGIQKLEERLRSRLEWGLSAQLKPADLESKVAILKRLAEIERISLSGAVARYIASKTNSDIRLLESALMRIVALASLRGVYMGLELAREVMSDLEREVLAGDLKKRIEVVDVSNHIVEMLREDSSYIYQLSPEKFELLICDRLSRMGFEVERVGNTYARDGGVDIVAWPKAPSPFPYLLATQVKHHRNASRKTGPDVVKNLQAVVASQPFQAGLLITNTSFTPTARWFAESRPHLVRLRDFWDLKRWIWDNFIDEAEWREIPARVELCPGVVINIPSKSQ